jgi:hypothetical protein
MAATAPPPSFRLNIEECVRFLARDPAWPRKLGLGVLWSLLGFTIVGAFFVQGYLLLLTERVARAEPLPLPEWADYGALLRRGWRVFVTNLVYQLPSLLLGSAIGALLLVTIVGFVRGFTARNGVGPNPLLLSPLAFLLIIPLILLLVLVGFLVGLITPAALAQLVLHDRVGAALDLGAVLAFIRRNLGQYALAIALYLGANLLLGGLSFGARFTVSGTGGRPFWTEPLFILAVLATLSLLALRTIGGFFVQLCFSHLLGQLCWYDRQIAARGVDGS